MPETPRQRDTAEPITATIADNVRLLRERSGMSQADLAGAMSTLGVPWKRTTVVNLEKRGSSSRGVAATGRDAVTVTELLALAMVLRVPPVTLLADPRTADQVPISSTTTANVWATLRWLIGSGLVDYELPANRGVGEYETAAAVIRAVRELPQAVDDLRRYERAADPADPADDDEKRERQRARDDARHRGAISTIVSSLIALESTGARLPPVPADAIVRRAAELDLLDLTELSATLRGRAG